MRAKISFLYNPLLLLGFLSIVLMGCPPKADPPVEPILTTSAAASVTTISAISGGNVTIDGGASITNRGVCWNTSPGPSISNSKTSDGSGTGSFTSSLSGLNPGVKYYVRAYATNSVGTGYGNEISFSTAAALSAITTTAITSITAASASSGGNVTADGGGAITARGVCWSTTTGPTISNNKTNDGSGTGSFVSSITGLSAGVKYYVRAYATNSAGTSYGSEVSFTALANLPTLTTTVATSITTTTATSGGNVTSDGGSSITTRGVCWGTTANPTTANSKTTDTGTTGLFTSSITGLIAGTTYYVRAYATNSAGTAYGTEVSFTTTASNSIIFNPSLTYGTMNDIEGNVYKTIQIGTQVWMAENLKTTKLKDGTTIPLVTDQPIWATLSTPGYCWYNNDAINYKSTYGALYNWFTVSTNNLCPTGWHVPTDTEWTTLTSFLGGDLSVVGGKLKETGSNHWFSPNYGATNEKGFTALPGGWRWPAGVSQYMQAGGYWWSSTTYNTDFAWFRYAYYDYTGLYATNGDKHFGFSVRCISGELSIPTLSTNPTSLITGISAASGGNITSDGGVAITARGVCWSTTANPTINNSKTTETGTTGIFSSPITALIPGSTYYVRAYATNSVGTAYGNQITFTTIFTLSLATVTTTAATNITATTATSGGNITSDGGATITARGVCWSTSSNPTIVNSKTTETGTTGLFTSSITGLLAGTTYYVRAYAANSAGTAYGSEISFTTTTATSGIVFNPSLTYGTMNDIDGNVYKTIRIGTRVWMAENLKTTKYKDGTTIPLETVNTAWSNLSSSGTCWYKNDAATYKNTYGGLYNWYTVNTGKLCPTGWHVPSDVEWTALTTSFGGESVSGGKLKETGTTHWTTPNSGATNESGFTLLPGGYRYYDGTFDYLGKYGYWWSSTEYSTSRAFYRVLSYDYSDVGKTNISKQYGFSVRCILDEASLATLTTNPISLITTTTAASGGHITSDGGAAITARGVCWSTTTGPTINGSKTTETGTTGIFSSPITGLIAGTTYYVRAYATNSAGTAYGNQITFATSQAYSYATVLTLPVSNFASTSATLNGNVTSDGGATITVRGFCFSTIPNPTLTNSLTSQAGSTGVYSSPVTLLMPGTTYYVRAYASNIAGTAYGNEVSFTTTTASSSGILDCDGNSYLSVTIGTQVWMTTNLKVTKYNDCTPIPLVTDNSAWGNLTTPGYCWYNNDATYKSTYGAIYNWFTVNTGKLCPTGWHVPSDSEWTVLTTFLGGEEVAGGKLKEAGTSHWLSPNTGATNSSGFTAVPGGGRDTYGTFGGLGTSGTWWPSTAYNTTNAWFRAMYNNFGNVGKFYFDKPSGFSVRCLKD